MLPDEPQVYSSCTNFRASILLHDDRLRRSIQMAEFGSETGKNTPCTFRRNYTGNLLRQTRAIWENPRKSCLFHEAIVSSAVSQDAGLPRPARRAFSDGEATTSSAKNRSCTASTSRLGNEDGRWVSSQGPFGGSFRLRHVGRECSCLGKPARVGPAKRRRGPCPWGAARTSAWGAPSAAAAWPAVDPPPAAGPPRGMSWTPPHLS